MKQESSRRSWKNNSINQRKTEITRKQEESQSRDMLDELRSLRDAHAKLQLEMDSDQGRHRRDLDSLTAQVASFRKAQSESSDLIKKLETKNADLTAIGALSQATQTTISQKSKFRQ